MTGGVIVPGGVEPKGKRPVCANCGRSWYHHSTWGSWCKNGTTKYAPEAPLTQKEEPCKTR